MSPERIIATYDIETAHPLNVAAQVLAGEQSTGTFIRLPGETDELRAHHGARIESISPHDDADVPTLPHATRPPGSTGTRVHRGRVVVSFPIENMGPSLPNLVATVMGNLYELREFSGLKLMDLELPQAFADAYPGPQFGIAGTRRLAGVNDRPLIGTIIKPSVGLDPNATAAIVKTLAQGGLDFIKDDELQANGPHCPFAQRVSAVMRVINDHAQRTGQKPMYAFNITGDLDEMKRHHDLVVEHGGTCVMLSLNSVGIPAAHAIRKHSALPIHGHRNGWGMYTRSPALGIDFAAYQVLWRHVGVDHLHCNGLKNKFWEPDESVLRSVRACLKPLPHAKTGYTVMPVIASAQWAGQAPDTYQHLKTVDLMYVCGGGIMAHPAGIGAGVASVRQGWEAAVKGISLETYAETRPELASALQAFGK